MSSRRLAGERIRGRPHKREAARTNCPATNAGRVRCAFRYSRAVLCRRYASPRCSRIANTGADPHTTRNIFHRMWVCFFMKRENSTRDARKSVRRKNSNKMSKKECTRPPPQRLRTNVTNKGDAKRRRKSSTGMRGSFAKDVGPLQHTLHARVALESARNE